ncbi:hypothetical protein D3C78_1057790 [compost metagenome]
MVGGAVVALAVVFPDELPIALFDDRAFMRDLRFPDAVRSHVALDFLAHGLEIRRLIGKADEDVTGDGFAGDRLQAEIALVELFTHVTCEEQLAVEIVGPLVVRTDKARRLALLRGADAGAAVATGIVEGADLPIATANDDDGIGADLNGEIAAGLLHFAIMADKQPVAIPDRFHIQLEIIRVRVEGLFQAEAFAAVFQLAQYGITQFHGQILDQTALPDTICGVAEACTHLNTGGHLRQHKQRHRLPHWRQIATCAIRRRSPFRWEIRQLFNVGNHVAI